MNVFISYARQDREFVISFATTLQRWSFDIWFDKPDIQNEWNPFRLIDESDVFLFMMSQESVPSLPCRQEWEYALQRDKPVIPILLEPVEFPSGLPHYKSFDLSISVHDHIDALARHIQWAKESNTRRVQLLQRFKPSDTPNTSRCSDETALGSKQSNPIVKSETASPPKLPSTHLHIMLSGQGGAGKTTLALSLCHYLARHKDTVTVDLNHYTSDTFTLLSDSKPVYPAPPHWICTARRDQVPGKVIVQEKTGNNPIGYENFWREIRELINFPTYVQHDFIVDTNLSISNVCLSRKKSASKPSIFQQLVQEDPTLYIYLWFIWTPQTISNPDEIANSIEWLYRVIPEPEAHRINYIHVLNPYVLDPSHRQSKTLKQAVGLTRSYRELESSIQTAMQNFRYTGNAEPIDNRTLEPSEVLNTLQIKVDQLLDELQEQQTKPHIYKGLKHLLYEEPPTPNLMTVNDFCASIGHYLTHYQQQYAFETLCDFIYQSLFHTVGRPYNLLPLTTYNPSLSGMVFDKEEEFFWVSVEGIRRDVAKFMEDLDLMEHQHPQVGIYSP